MATKNTDEDRYPQLRKVLQHALDHEDFPKGPVDRFEITCLASGQGTWRVWAAKAEDPVGGVYTNS